MMRMSSSSSKQCFLSGEGIGTPGYFASRVTKAFLSADIPLHKLNNPELKSLFQFMGKAAPSESSCRSKVSALHEEENQRLKSLLAGKDLFLVVDEAEVADRKYINIIVGDVNIPAVTYLLGCDECSVSVSQQVIIHAVDDAMRFLDADRGRLVLLLSDAARYMTAAGDVLRQLYPRLFHVTCTAHLLHNCAEKVRAYYTKVDKLIAAVKAATVRNRTRKEQFATIGYPPVPVVTRWASWLKAAKYYANNLPTVIQIVKSFSGKGLLVSRAKEAVCQEGLQQDLLAVSKSYLVLIDLVLKCESTSYTIADAHRDLQSLNFEEDPCDIRSYLQKRVKQNKDLTGIMELSRPDIPPALYGKLQLCQATSACVERSFSMLNKLHANNRNFKAENVSHYLKLKYNAKHH